MYGHVRKYVPAVASFVLGTAVNVSGVQNPALAVVLAALGMILLALPVWEQLVASSHAQGWRKKIGGLVGEPVALLFAGSAIVTLLLSVSPASPTTTSFGWLLIFLMVATLFGVGWLGAAWTVNAPQSEVSSKAEHEERSAAPSMPALVGTSATPVTDAEDEVGHHYHYGSPSSGLVGTATLLWEPNERNALERGHLVVSNFTGAQSVTVEAFSAFSDHARTVIATFEEPVGPFKVDVSRGSLALLGDNGKIVVNKKKECHVSLPVNSGIFSVSPGEPETIRLFFYRRTFD